MPPILDTSDWPAVRAALDIELDATVLPDDTIALSIFQGEAENRFLTRVAGANPAVDLTSQESKNACIYYLAAMLSPHLSRYTMEMFGDSRSNSNQVSWDMLESVLMNRGDEIVDVLLGLDPIETNRATVFRLANGLRML
jgi:hypothetical protein